MNKDIELKALIGKSVYVDIFGRAYWYKITKAIKFATIYGYVLKLTVDAEGSVITLDLPDTLESYLAIE